MLVSRVLGLLRKSSRLAQPKRNPIKHQTRKSHDEPAHHDPHHDPADGWRYRDKQPVQPGYERAADYMTGLMWWWILHRLYHDWDATTGNKNYPQPHLWTDAELGIPPDDQVYENFNPESCVYPPGFYDDVKK